MNDLNSLVGETVQQDMHNEVIALATFIHDLDCHDPNCSWGFENWIFKTDNDNIFTGNFHTQSWSKNYPTIRRTYYEKADKVYTFFNQNFKNAKKCIDLIFLTNPLAAKAFISSL